MPNIGLLIRRIGFLFICSFAMQSAASGQTKMEGVIRYLAVSNWTKMMRTLDYLSPQQKERVAYIWGNRSEWKSYKKLYFSDAGSKYEDSEEKAEPDDEGYSWRKSVYFIRRDFERRLIHDAVTMLGKTYIIEDSLHEQNWKILNDMKEVAGHVCMNAFWEDTVKHQRITVWFALDLPVPAGPERLCGLPGIILEADYNDGALVLTADKIEFKPLTNEMDLPKKIKGKKVKEAEYQTAIKKHMEEKRKSEEPWFWGLRY